MTNSPNIAFAKTPSDRDLLRGIIKGWDQPFLFFDSEIICFDNLSSIKPQVILIRTDSKKLIWRFAFALNALKLRVRLLVVTNGFDGSQFHLDGIQTLVNCFPLRDQGETLTHFLKKATSAHPGSDRPIKQELLVGESVEIKNANLSLNIVKASSDPILITGEKGTGKELLARRIADHVPDSSIFIKIDCAHFANEKIGLMQRDEVRNAGMIVVKTENNDLLPHRATILFHRINRLSQSGQLEVLALMEDGFETLYDFGPTFRIIATAETDLNRMVEHNRFRQDLFYRLNVIPVNLPPLRQRREDIPLLIDYLSIEACSRLQRSHLLVSPQVVEKLRMYHWPGNVDELKRAIDRFAVSGSEAQILAHIGLKKGGKNNSLLTALDDNTLPDSLEIQSCLSAVGSVPLKSICEKFIHQTEKMILQKALEATKWNRKKAAELLNISYKSMLNKMKIYEIV